ncbi:hypothetical protein B0T14DRAFT_417426 [Immersiella caudata]|uniref:Uncharacterized protein n=1 Tax=Immersiella caudata TaxID=314043 RepID=A0AA39XGL4_9PEZI|nr:hypothetical protein B0T14DRAFT_417426 [Immersiella caudata]
MVRFSHHPIARVERFPCPLRDIPFRQRVSCSGNKSCESQANHQQLPGVRCPKCAEKGEEVWVIQGRACGHCGTACY